MRVKSSRVTTDYINSLISDNKDLIDTNEISDTFHSFGELYTHRCTLFVALCKRLHKDKVPVWRSKRNSNGSVWDGWFLLGINHEKGKQISYHLPMDMWELTNFAETLDKSPEFDGHTPDDVLSRLVNIL